MLEKFERARHLNVSLKKILWYVFPTIESNEPINQHFEMTATEFGRFQIESLTYFHNILGPTLPIVTEPSKNVDWLK